MINPIHNIYKSILQNTKKIFLKCDNNTLSKNVFIKHYSSSSTLKVTVIGAAGKVGQPLCLMLKQSPLIDELCLYDIKHTSALAMELNHIDTKCKVTAFTGKEMPQALNNSKVVAVIAAAPNTETMPLDKMWLPNAPVIESVITEFAKCCPKAFLAISTNPINSIIPMASEILKKCGCFNPNTTFGITSIDVIRTNTFVAQIQGLEPECVTVPVIGGHSEETIVPVLSQASPCAEFTDEEIENLTKSIKKAHQNLIRTSPIDGTPLSGAFAIARFVISLVKAIKGFPDIIECAFIPTTIYPYLKYFATPLLLGPNGVMKNLNIPKLSHYEQCLLDNSIQHLSKDAKKGEMFVGVVDPPICDPCDANPNKPRCPQAYCDIRSMTSK